MATFDTARLKPLRWIVPVLVVVVVGAVLGSRAFLDSEAGLSFLERYPGASATPEGTPGGFSWWIQILHAANFIFIALLIRSGWMVHSQQRPEAYWNKQTKSGPPIKISIYLWLHLMVDVLWIVGGLIFVVLLFVTGAWGRIVPVHWDIFPNAVSAALQYASFTEPPTDPWSSFNALQVLAYFTVIFIAAPLAALTGFRMSPVWRNEWSVSKVFPVSAARFLHLPIMVFIAAFTVVHVVLVVVTGMRLNMNTMYAATAQGSESWWGPAVFLVVLIVAVGAWLAARPMFLAPVASMTGRVSER